MKFAINEELPEMSIVLAYMFKVAHDNKMTTSNKFSFDSNDFKKGYKAPIKIMSNHIWRQDNGLVLTSKDFSFYVLKNDNTVSVYVHDNKYDYVGLDSLIKKIKEYPQEVEKNRVLKTEKDNAIFVNQNFIVAFSNNLKITKIALINNGYGEPEYPVDIKSYEYQLAYWQKKTRIPEFDFVNNVLQGGLMSEYDPEKGRFYIKNTKYDPTVIGFKMKERNQREKVTIVESNKVDFEYLDKDWHTALNKVIEVLKRDRPQYSGKENNLDSLIKFYEKKINSKVAQSSLNFNRKLST